MSDTDLIDHESTDEIVCPYCGNVDGDSWEYSRNEGELECHECNKKFSYSRHTEVTYSTNKNCAENNIEHDYGAIRTFYSEVNQKNLSYQVCETCGEHNRSIDPDGTRIDDDE